ncbi:MAG: hypothetical protein FJZ57_03405 [Chlamydiae bacterium]|nr:hypothetical protein [Chlamydiota bacterium]
MIVYRNSRILSASNKVSKAILSFKDKDKSEPSANTFLLSHNRELKNVSTYKMIPNSYLKAFHLKYDFKKYRKVILKLGVIMDSSNVHASSQASEYGRTYIPYYGLLRKLRSKYRTPYLKDRCKSWVFKERSLVQVKISEITKSFSAVRSIRDASLLSNKDVDQPHFIEWNRVYANKEEERQFQITRLIRYLS